MSATVSGFAAFRSSSVIPPAASLCDTSSVILTMSPCDTADLAFVVPDAAVELAGEDPPFSFAHPPAGLFFPHFGQIFSCPFGRPLHPDFVQYLAVTDRFFADFFFAIGLSFCC